MRKKLCVAALVAVFCTGTIAAKNDQFDDVDCTKPQESMLGMKVCSGRSLQEVEAKLRSVQNKILKSADSGDKKSIRAWFKAGSTYAEAKCSVEELQVKGGSMQTLVYGSCLDSEYQRQLKEITEYANRPEGG